MQTLCQFKLKKLFLLIGAFLLALFTPFSLAVASDTQAFESIKQQLMQVYLQKAQQQNLHDIKITIRPFSPSLKLPRCKQPILFEDKQLQDPAKFAGRHTVKISCQTPKWKFYASIIIHGTLPAIISTQGIIKNAVITEGMVKQVWQDARRVNSRRLIHLKTVIGMRAKRPIPPGKVLTVNDVIPPYLVKAKNEVTIMTKLGSLSISTKGIALKNGVYGEQIPVKNRRSGKIINAIVTGRDLVEVP